MIPQLGKSLIFLGIILLAIGLLIYFSPQLSKIPVFRNLGKLPGDINIQRENFRFYFPLASSIVISVLLSLIIFLLRFFRK